MASGTITLEEFRNMTVPVQFMTSSMIRAPFLKEDSEVYRSGLQLTKVDSFSAPNDLEILYDNLEKTRSNVEEYVGRCVGWVQVSLGDFIR